MRAIQWVIFIFLISSKTVAATLEAEMKKLPQCTSSDGRKVTYMKTYSKGVASSSIIEEHTRLHDYTIPPGNYIFFDGEYFTEFPERLVFTMAHECGHFQGKNLQKMMTNLRAADGKNARISGQESMQGELDSDCWAARWMKSNGFSMSEIESGASIFTIERRGSATHPSMQARVENLEVCLGSRMDELRGKIEGPRKRTTGHRGHR